MIFLKVLLVLVILCLLIGSTRFGAAVEYSSEGLKVFVKVLWLRLQVFPKVEKTPEELERHRQKEAKKKAKDDEKARRRIEKERKKRERAEKRRQKQEAVEQPAPSEQPKEEPRVEVEVIVEDKPADPVPQEADPIDDLEQPDDLERSDEAEQSEPIAPSPEAEQSEPIEPSTEAEQPEAVTPPDPPKAPEAPKEPTKPAEPFRPFEKIKQIADDVGGKLATLQELLEKLLPPVLEAVGDLLKSIRVDNLTLRYTIAGRKNPAAAAIQYGQVCVGGGAIAMLLEQALTVKEREVRAWVDFSATEPLVYAYLALTLTVGQVLFIVLRLGIKAAIWFLGRKYSRWKQRRQAKKKKNTPKAEDNNQSAE